MKATFFLVCLTLIFSFQVFAQQRAVAKPFWDNGVLTTSETVYRLGGGVYVKAVLADLKYVGKELHIIWQLNAFSQGRLRVMVWKEFIAWDGEKKAWTIVKKEEWRQRVNPEILIEEFFQSPDTTGGKN